MAGSNTITIELSDDQLEYLTRPLHGQGGFQSFLKQLQRKISGNRLTLDRSDCEKIVRYSEQYGEGGFQGRLRTIIDAAEAFLNS